MKNIDFPRILFVTGTGTDVGKSFAAGWLAREILKSGKRCITQKMVQTGNTGRSEDIERHRSIMGCGDFPEDLSGLTAPVIFSYPASPHLAARLDGKEIDLDLISKATETLAEKYDHIVVEGAGGLMVPLKDDFLTANYIALHKLPTVLVVSGELGSINHALLSLNAISSYGIDLFAVIYNPHFDRDKTICADSRQYLRRWTEHRFPTAKWIEMPENI